MPALVVRGEPADNTAAIFNMMLSVALFSVMDATSKWLSQTYPVAELLFFRSFFALVPLTVLVSQCGGWRELRSRQPVLQGLRALAGLASMALFFLAFRSMPLADAIAIAFAGPLFMTVLSIPMLHEQVGLRRWAAVVVGFVGVLVIARPGAGIFGLTALLPLAGALCGALAMIFVRRLSVTDSNASIICYHALLCTAVSAVWLPFEWVTPAPLHWLPLIALGLIGGTAQIFLTQAFRLAPAAAIAPFKYTAIIFAIGFGYLLFGDVPDGWTLAGASVVVGSGLYILHRESVRRAEARKLKTA